ncbi:MAG: tetratricopeptide repeat protein [Paracoccaceae bacterium]
MRLLLFACPLVLSATVAWAACPAPPEIADKAEAFFAELEAAQNEMQAQSGTRGLWELWLDAPDATAQEMLDQGMAARRVFDFLGAIDRFDRLVDYCPDYAEGYNQRAFVHFLREDFAAALVDLDLALERSPKHVGALSGKALTLMGLGRDDEAQDVLRDALELNPWIPERGLLKGKDI